MRPGLALLFLQISEEKAGEKLSKQGAHRADVLEGILPSESWPMCRCKRLKRIRLPTNRLDDLKEMASGKRAWI